MAFLPQVYTVGTFTTSTSLSPAVNFQGCYLYVYLVVPTMSAGYSAGSTPIFIQGSADGVTYQRFTNVETNTTTVGSNDFTIQSSTSSRIVSIPNFALPYAKIEISGTVTTPANASLFKFVCVSNQ